MRRTAVGLVLILLMAACAEAATLAYTNGTYVVSGRTIGYVDIVASESGVNFWSMRVYRSVSDGHAYWMPGEIASFKDLRFGGTAFEYSPEAALTSSVGLMRMTGMQGTFSDTGGQNAGYYQFTKNYTASNINYLLTYRINAPTVSGDGHVTNISVTYTVTNNSGASFSLWGTGTTAGCASLNLAYGGYTNWAFVNPDSLTAKPVVHNTDTTDGHQLYIMTDWVGSKVTSALPGFQARAEVKNNAYTQARNMRPGLIFEVRADNMSFYYSDQANTIYGGVAVNTTNGVRGYLNNQPGVFGSGATLPVGQSTSMSWTGLISAPSTNSAPVADAGQDVAVWDYDQNDVESVTLDGSGSTDAEDNITGYVWKENDVQIATGVSPSVNFAVGVHTVTLEVTDAGGLSSSDTVSINIRNYDPPLADAGDDIETWDYDQTQNEAVTLDGSGSYDSDGNIVSYVWKEGGAQLATGLTADLTFAEGVHTVTLEVTDNDGLTGSDTVTVNVHHVEPVILDFTQSGTNLTIVARKQDDSHRYWEILIDETKGVIKSFKNLDSGAGTRNYVSSYGFTPGLFAPFDSGIRNGTYTYTAGAKVDGQSSYTYTLYQTFGTGNVNWRLSEVTIQVPTLDGTRFMAKNSVYNNYTATTTQKATPYMDLYAANSTQMNDIYQGSAQADLGVDGTLWARVEVKNSQAALDLGMTPGLVFRLTGLVFTDGTTNLDNAASLVWSASLQAENYVTGGIYNNYASKPPAGSTSIVYTRVDINIDGDGYIANSLPAADAGSDQQLTDQNDNGSELVTLDGSLSSDADGPLISYVWTEGASVVATGSGPQVTLHVGMHNLTLTVTDAAGATAADQVTVNVISRTPTTYYVDRAHAQASDSNPGTAALPWLTIGKGTNTAMPGDTVIVKEGVYRESVALHNSGSLANPITFRGNTGDRVVISGADELTGWTQCTSSYAARNAGYASIYYKDISWKPSRLDEDEVKLTVARSPNSGWWVIGTGTAGTSVVDSTNLTQSSSSYWVGATMFFRNLQPVSNTSHTVTAFAPSTDTLTVTPALATDATPGTDLYYLHNRLELIDVAGEWAAEDQGGGTWRIFVRPSDGQNPSTHVYEATRRNGYLWSWGSQAYNVIDGFEIRGGQVVGVNDSYAMGSASNADNITVKNCTVHGNEFYGINVRGTNITIKNNLVFDNGYGVGVGNSAAHVTVEGNEMHNNTVDAMLVTYYATDVHIKKNYIHDHFLWGHPDNCQTYVFPSDVWFEDNYMVNAGQSVMMEETDDVHFVNNVIVGSHAYMMILGHSNTNGVYFNGNTFALSGYSIVNNTQGDGRDWRNNIMYQGHGNTMFAANDTMNFVSNYNIVTWYSGATNPTVGWNSVTMTFDSYRTQSGQDANSYDDDPMFVNVPKYYEAMDAYDLPYYLANRVYMRNSIGLWAVNDHIEINFDGVNRTISAIGSDSHGPYLEFTPAFAAPLVTAGVVSNWKTVTNYAMDFALRTGSPGIGTGEGGRNIGSLINVANYRAGDFDGDSQRDIPSWPPAP